MRGEPVLGESLERDVHREADIVPRHPFHPVDLADDPSERVDLDLTRARLAAQREIAGLLDPVLADAKAGQLKQRIVAELGLGNRGDIAQHMD